MRSPVTVLGGRRRAGAPGQGRRRLIPGRLRARLLHNRVARAIRLSRAVTRPARFVLAEAVLRDGRARTWQLRDGVPVLLRSGGRDLDIFEEIFHAGEYDPPDEVAAILRARPRPRVVDLGGNIGLFALRMFQRLPGCTVTSFEPDPGNLELLLACRAAAGLADRWTVHPVAAGVVEGRAAFLSGQEADSRVVAPGLGTIEVPVWDVFEHLGGCDLLKIDIEGGEWDILADERFGAAGATAVALEFHGYRRPFGDDIRAAATELLRRCGYLVRHVAWHPVGVGRLWAWRG
mgnify:CR=1 FL=1